MTGLGSVGQSTDCVSGNLKKLRPDIPPEHIECASNFTSSSNCMKLLDQMDICQNSSLPLQSADQGCFSIGNGNPIRSSSRSKSAECRYTGLALNATMEHTNNRKTRDMTILKQVERRCYSEVHMFSFGDNTPVVKPNKNEVSDESLCASLNGNSVNNGSLSVGTLNHSIMGEGKQQAVSSTADFKDSSSESEDSHDSVESSSSKRPLLAGKRARSYHLETSLENKRSKKQICEGFSAGSFPEKTSSFMNWVSTITHGFSRFSEATPLAFVPPPSRHIEENVCLSLSVVKDKERDVNCISTGFRSMFQSLYLPGANMKLGRGAHPTDYEAVKQLKIGSEHSYSRSQLHCTNVELDTQNLVHSRNERPSNAFMHNSWSEQPDAGSRGTQSHYEGSLPGARLNKDLHQVKESPSTENNMTSGVSVFCENTKIEVRQTGNLGNIGCTSYSPENGSHSSSTGKSDRRLLPSPESSSKLVSNRKNEILQNLWITRLSPKVSLTVPASVQDMHGTNLAGESAPKNYSLLDSQVQNIVASSKPQGSSENTCLPLLQNRTNVMDCRNLNPLKKGKEKVNSNSNPACELQKTEAMASSFAKRLDLQKFQSSTNFR